MGGKSDVAGKGKSSETFIIRIMDEEIGPSATYCLATPDMPILSTITYSKLLRQ